MVERRRKAVSRRSAAGSKDYREAVVSGDPRHGGENRGRRAVVRRNSSDTDRVRRRVGKTTKAANGSRRDPVVVSKLPKRKTGRKVNTDFAKTSVQAYGSFTPGNYVVRRTIRDNLVTAKMEHGPETRTFRDDKGDLSILHVSDVQYQCMRRLQLSHRFGVRMVESPVWASLGMTYAMGLAIENFIRNRVQSKSPNTIWGDWRCGCGKGVLRRKSGEEIQLEPHQCFDCNSQIDRYTGILLENKDAGIIGNVDLGLLVNDHVYPIEIKSIKKNTAGPHIGWDDLKEPFPMHAQQIVTYWFMAAEEDLPMCSQVSVVYACKEYMFGSPFKEFTIKPLEKRNPLLAHEVFDRAREFHERKDEGNLFNRLPECNNPQSAVPKKCDQCTLCFQMGEPEREADE